jgi:hypothetical protein
MLKVEVGGPAAAAAAGSRAAGSEAAVCMVALKPGHCWLEAGPVLCISERFAGLTAVEKMVSTRAASAVTAGLCDRTVRVWCALRCVT